MRVRPLLTVLVGIALISTIAPTTLGQTGVAQSRLKLNTESDVPDFVLPGTRAKVLVEATYERSTPLAQRVDDRTFHLDAVVEHGSGAFHATVEPSEITFPPAPAEEKMTEDVTVTVSAAPTAPAFETGKIWLRARTDGDNGLEEEPQIQTLKFATKVDARPRVVPVGPESLVLREDGDTYGPGRGTIEVANLGNAHMVTSVENVSSPDGVRTTVSPPQIVTEPGRIGSIDIDATSDRPVDDVVEVRFVHELKIVPGHHPGVQLEDEVLLEVVTVEDQALRGQGGGPAEAAVANWPTAIALATALIGGGWRLAKRRSRS